MSIKFKRAVFCIFLLFLTSVGWAIPKKRSSACYAGLSYRNTSVRRYSHVIGSSFEYWTSLRRTSTIQSFLPLGIKAGYMTNIKQYQSFRIGVQTSLWAITQLFANPKYDVASGELLKKGIAKSRFNIVFGYGVQHQRNFNRIFCPMEYTVHRPEAGFWLYLGKDLTLVGTYVFGRNIPVSQLRPPSLLSDPITPPMPVVDVARYVKTTELILSLNFRLAGRFDRILKPAMFLPLMRRKGPFKSRNK